MAEEAYNYNGRKIDVDGFPPAAAEVESTDRGLFDFAKGKKDEKRGEEGFSSEFGEKIEVHEENKHHGSLLQKLHRSSSNSSSSSEEEEVDENGEKKKKKNLKDKIKDKICGGKTEETDDVVKVDYEFVDNNSVPIEKYGDFPEEKKGFVEKIKEKLPGGKKAEDTAEYYASPEEHSKEKKGFLDKIKEKIPGYQHHKEEEKEKEKDVGNY